MPAIQKNKEIVQRLYDDCLNKRNMNLLPALIDDEYAGLQGAKGAAAFEQIVSPLIKAFPDIQWKIEEMIGEENKVVVKWKWEGTHTNAFRNFVATGKKITNAGIAIFDLKNGKITGNRVQTDQLGFLQEIGAVPRDVTSLTNKSAGKDRVGFIDKFVVPAASKDAFYERMAINRSFIKTLPGFIEDGAWEYTDTEGNLICVTVAVWENKEALDKAKESVQAEYKKQGVDMQAMMKRLNITVDRGIYKPGN